MKTELCVIKTDKSLVTSNGVDYVIRLEYAVIETSGTYLNIDTFDTMGVSDAD